MSITTLAASATQRRSLSDEERYEFYNNILEQWQHFQEGIFTDFGMPSNRVRVRLSLAEDTISFTLVYCCVKALADKPGKEARTLTEQAVLIGLHETPNAENVFLIRQLVSFNYTTEQWRHDEQKARATGSSCRS